MRALQAEFRKLMLVDFSKVPLATSTVMESGTEAPIGRKLQQTCSTSQAANPYASINVVPTSVDWVSGLNTGLSGGEQAQLYAH
jgi:hypothetical protein